MERHLRLVVDCYKKICIILGDHLTKTGRPIDKEPSAEDSTFDPLQELAKEVASGVKVSRAVLMVIPPDKYINARNSSHVTPKEDVSIIGLHASPTSVGRESSSKQSRFSKREKSATVHSLSFGDDPAPLHTNGEGGHTPVVHSEENSPVVSNNVKSHTRSPQPAGGRVRNRHRSGLSKYSSAGSKTLEPSGEEISEGSSDEKLSLCDSPPRQKPKPLNCRCGTNNPVSLDKICVRAKCPCFSSNVGCKDCHCKHSTRFSEATAMAAVKCVCQICTCGRHRCPQHPQSTIMVTDTSRPCNLSEYSTEFKTYGPQPRREGFRPTPVPNSMNQGDGSEPRTTTTKQDYVAHTITPQPPRTPVMYKTPEGAMQKESEYKFVYVPKKSVPAKPIRHVSATRTATDSKFDHKSSHTTDYVPLHAQKTQSYAEKRSYRPPTEPFEGASTIQTDFVDHGNVPPPAPMRPVQNTVATGQSFDGSSSYKEAFVPLQLPDKFVAPKQVYKPSSGEFHGETTFKCDFKSYDGTKPAQSLKPVGKAQSSAEPFEGVTINRESYKVWDMPTKFTRPQAVYAPPTEKFSAQTTVQADFRPLQAAPTKSIRPQERAKDSNASFDGSTTQKMDYKEWKGAERAKSLKEVRVYQPPTDKFDGVSTCSAHYKGQYTPPAPSTKPQLSAAASTQPFDGSTSYHDSYAPFIILPRPKQEKERFKPPEGEFLSETTFKHDYKTHDGSKPAQSLKPVRKAQSTAEPFEGFTINRESYKVWDMPTKFTRPQAVYAPPTEKFSAQTTVQADFRPFQAAPTKSIRPQERAKDSNASFDGSTTQKVDYKEWKGAERAKSLKEVRAYQPPTDKFDGVSTCSAHYKGQYTPPAQLKKPTDLSLYHETTRLEQPNSNMSLKTLEQVICISVQCPMNSLSNQQWKCLLSCTCFHLAGIMEGSIV
ncbi:hypothetical protein EMCRGX_G026264 [Ephydatia muelleri]